MFVEEPELALKIWINYNQKLLSFYDRFPGKCFIASVYNVSKQPAVFIQALNNKFKTNLEKPAADLYEQSLLHTQVSDSYHPDLVNFYFPEATKIYRALNALEQQNGLLPDLNWEEKIETTPEPAGAFQDWIRIRRLEKKVKNLQAELEKARLKNNLLNGGNMMSA